jgi:hypothetical protein
MHNSLAVSIFVRNKFVYLTIAGGAFCAVAIMLVLEAIRFIDYWIGLAVSLSITSFTLIGIALKPLVEGWINSTRPLTKRMKYLSDLHVKNGVTTYNSQRELPNLRKVLSKAEKTIEVLATTNEYMLFKESDFIKNAINKDIKVTILLPDPNSEYTLKKKQVLPDATNLVQRIQTSFDVLCSQKVKFKDKLDIRKYDLEIYKTILIIDREAKDPWIRVDEYALGIKTSSRRTREGSKREAKDFCEPLLKEYEKVLEISESYHCS